MPPRKKSVSVLPENNLAPEEQVIALTELIFKMRKKEIAQYASSVSDKQQIKALLEENQRLHKLIPDPKEKLEKLADTLRAFGSKSRA